VKVLLVPSSVAAGAQEPAQFLSTVLLNDTVAIDAGCLGLYRTPEEQARVRHLLISHTHLDHLASLPVFLENAFEAGGRPVTLHGTAAVLDCLHRDLFNDRLWPDFIELSRGEPKFLQLALLEPGKPVQLDGLRVTPVAVDHLVPTVGFVVEEDGATVVFSSDTGPTVELWQHANRAADLRAVFLEVTFPDALAELAAVSRHLTPATFAGEVAKLRRPVPVIAVHLKPRYREQIVRELEALNLPQVEVGRFGWAYEL
jgi:ribonuclease BN (tRNA processing enzyme)